MRSYWVIPFALIGLSGCVTETHSVTKNSPVVNSEVNNLEAARTRISLALEYLKAGNNTQAKFNLERAAKFAPKLPEVHYTLAYYFEQVKEFQQAKASYKTALKLVPNDPNTLNNYGTFLCRIGEYDEARAQLLKAIDTRGYLRVSQSYENLALCAVKQDKFELALDYLNSAVQHDGQSKSALISLAGLYYAKSDLHQALRVLERYTDNGFISSRSLFLEYLLHQEMGHLEQSQKIATTLVQTYPQSYQAQAIITENYNNSEFDVLREQYRKAKVAEITAQSPTVYNAQPKIKITRKKAPKRESKDNREVEQPVIATNSSNVTVSDAVSLRTSLPASSEVEEQSQLKQPAITTGVTETQEKIQEMTLVTETPNNQVRVVSFGEKKPVQQAQGQVQFYQPDPSQVRFREIAENNDPVRTTKSSSASAPLLNPEVNLPNVPVHTVGLGENLFSLSVKYDVKMASLLKWNKLKESDRLQIGQQVYLNNPQVTHIIQDGDSLYNIATNYQLQIGDLMRWNKLTPDVELAAGHSLLIVDPSNYTL
ncbi:type IV pilus biogenesis/stability protein PilW [Pseudoalteromonas phenolica]|uniref:Lytic cell-wall binding lipoprotein n=1 Tax=Pseudoalteromonas phenolica TaxID=161398 RepID=A0A0S2JYR2_9GAMM|nr:type IV pilus biogenesis/stability protein PilW [Pseudoalteromonas phenolica]ALO41028.1 Lytic cell-wall binding lipoprotein [Pseudoalteromonas phenolica]MBE0354450.1 type IV pilus assembly protein PilF [Pseudoalteromonas phenolica O-BC30]